ncbi:dienelactone hydrolase family protein [Xenorhabdus thailandensis]|uniref:dienelactone hydrolase family protein n=1 Tax=Xenorhabdus thailandensis TaxID=3136255 RepID=UPI0030F39444
MERVELLYSAGSNDYLAYHVKSKGKIRILMFPDWQGCETVSARRLAEYYASSCDAEVILTDVYGKDRRPRSDDQADRVITQSLDNPFDTRELLKNIFFSLETHWYSIGPLFIVGFCFGGSLAFEFGRAELPATGVVSVHGQPDSRQPATGLGKKPAFLMLHGAEDPFITDTSLNLFMGEMRRINADWSVYFLGGAKHSFTRNDIPVGNPYMGYNKKADEEAVLALKIMSERLLTEKTKS